MKVQDNSVLNIKIEGISHLNSCLFICLFPCLLLGGWLQLVLSICGTIGKKKKNSQ